MQLGRKQKRTAGISSRKTFPHDFLTHEIAIIPGGIKINKSLFQKTVDEPVGFIKVDRPVIGGIAKGSLISPKPRFFT